MFFGRRCERRGCLKRHPGLGRDVRFDLQDFFVCTNKKDLDRCSLRPSLSRSLARTGGFELRESGQHLWKDWDLLRATRAGQLN